MGAENAAFWQFRLIAYRADNCGGGVMWLSQPWNSRGRFQTERVKAPLFEMPIYLGCESRPR
jgi:hypothetical protein